jgi:hypothetical protein
VMTPTLRKVSLAIHVASSVGWLGAVGVFLVLALVGLRSADPQLVRTAYLAMDMSARFVIVPLAFASLITGLVQSIGTPRGLLRHYWVLAKLLLTGIATVILLLKMAPISQLAGIAAQAAPSPNVAGLQVSLLLHAAGGVLVLLAIVTLGVFKPAGLTRYGARVKGDHGTGPGANSAIPTPAWVKVFGAVLATLVILLILMMVVGSHGPGMHARHA